MNREEWPGLLFGEYEQGIRYKQGLGSRGLYEQDRINERFFVGDQWHGANCGADRPLVRHNVIKRIADYKMAVVGAAPIAVSYSADGIANTAELRRETERLRDKGAQGRLPAGLTAQEEIGLVTSALSDYFRTTAERLQFEEIRDQALRGAYITGTGVVYTYWDESIPTGLYADLSRTAPITGDIACEVLDIENVYFGDPTLEDVQTQPYILISQRKSVEELQRMARRYGAKNWREIRPDRDIPGGDGWQEESKKATLLTRFWKEWDENGNFTIRAVQACRGVVVRAPWDLGIRLYPLAKFSWERRRGSAYGESEITYLIPNQIAINRMITASVWAVMMMGMPIMVVNGDVVPQPISNDPGQIVEVFGGGEEMENAIRYVNPPAFSPQFDANIASLINNTLTQSGINSAVLGDVRPDNTSAIIAVREAAIMPLQVVQNRFYVFCEDIARIWAEFWITQYGKRALKIEDERGVWYLPFDGDRYRDVLLSVRVDVGASSLWSETRSVETLDNLFDRQIIDAVQYLSRLPKGTVPNLGGLLRELSSQGGEPGEETAAKKVANNNKGGTAHGGTRSDDGRDDDGRNAPGDGGTV